MTGDSPDDNERAERVELFVRVVEIDGRLCQAGGGLSGSPDSCRCNVLMSTGEWVDRELFDRFANFGEVER